MTSILRRSRKWLCASMLLALAGCQQPPCANPSDVIPDDGDYTSSDAAVQFTVFTQDGVKKVLFRGLFAEVVDGVFHVRKGQILGTDCPTDGYDVCGRFLTHDTAEGTLLSLRDCVAAAPPLDWTAAIPASPSCANPCQAEVDSLVQLAKQNQDPILEIENGTGDGQRMMRSNAQSHTSVLFHRGESSTVTCTLAQSGTCRLKLLYGNDEPGTTDEVTIAVNGRTQTLALADTRYDCPAGEGWNNICVVESSETVSLNAGQNLITLTLSRSDEYGAELDAILVVAEGPSCLTASTVDELRSRIQQAPAGSVICVPAGTYTLDRSIDVARDDITIEGTGDQTVFELASGVHDPVFVLGEPVPYAPTTTRRGITLRKMRIKGYRFTNPQPGDELSSVPGRGHLRNNGVTVRQADDCLLEDLTIENAASGGVVLERACRRIVLRRITSTGHQYDGIAWDGDIQDSRIKNCILRENGAAGLSFDIGPTLNLITGCTIQGNASVGVFLRDSDRNCFIDNTIEDNGEDAVFIGNGDAANADAVENAFVNNRYTDNGRHGIWQAGDRCHDNCETGGSFSGNAGQAKMESFPTEAPLLTCAGTNACTD